MKPQHCLFDELAGVYDQVVPFFGLLGERLVALAGVERPAIAWWRSELAGEP